jgi:glycosyltransferase involved in cell wall biosynthesis
MINHHSQAVDLRVSAFPSSTAGPGRATEGSGAGDGSANTDSLRVLLVSAQFPFPPTWGFATRVHQLTRQVASRHRVTLLSYVEQDDVDALHRSVPDIDIRVVLWDPPSVLAKRTAQLSSLLSRHPYQSRFHNSPQMQRAIDALCSNGRFDIVQVETSVLCAFDFPVDLPLIIDEHNIEYEVLQRMHQSERSLLRRSFSGLEHRRFRRFEQMWWRRASGCVVTSRREQAIVHRHAPSTPVEVVPNGVDLDYFAPTQVAAEPDTVVFNGTLLYRPNLDAAYHLVDEIWPRVLEARPRAMLTIVGRAADADLRRLRRPGVVVTGEVPDVRPHLERAAVVAVPIRMGGGTRFKVLEALAMGKPVVSTALGCEGIDVRHGEHLWIADHPAAFASALTRLFDDLDLAARLGSDGRTLVEESYSWDTAGRRLDRLYRAVSAGSVRPMRPDPWRQAKETL